MARTSTGYLPEAPNISTDLSNEIEEEFQFRQQEQASRISATAALVQDDQDYIDDDDEAQFEQTASATRIPGDHVRSQSNTGSIMFPSHPTNSNSNNTNRNVNLTRHGRSGSTASAPNLNKRHSSNSTRMDYARYGALGDEAETSSIKLAGSRPVSRTSFRQQKNNGSKSTAAGGGGGGGGGHRRNGSSRTQQNGDEPDNGTRAGTPGKGLGYLFHDRPVSAYTDQSNGVNGNSAARTGKGVMKRGHSAVSSIGFNGDGIPVSRPGTSHTRTQSGGILDYPRRDDDEDDEDEEDEEEEREDTLNREEAWYMLKALVGLELDHEESQLWKLRDLDPKEDLFRGGDESGDDDDEYDDEIDARNVPILRYLIRHFFLTLPLVRDTVPRDATAPDDQVAYWTEGVFPIIRAMHNADLSKAEDRGMRSLGSQLYGVHLRGAIERFISAGLKLSSASLRPETEVDGIQSLPNGDGPTGNYNFMPFPSTTDNGGELESPDLSRQPESKRDSRRFSFSNLFGGAKKTTDSAPASPARNFTSSPRAAQGPSGFGANSRIPPTTDAERTHGTHDASADESPVEAASAALFPSPPVIGGSIVGVHESSPASRTTAMPPRPDSDGEEQPIRDSRSTKSGRSGKSGRSKKSGAAAQGDMKRSASRATHTTGGFTSGWDDSASFVSAQETAGQRTDHETDHEEPPVPALIFPSSSRMGKDLSDGGRTIEPNEQSKRISAWLEGEDFNDPQNGSSTARSKTPTQDRADDSLAGQPYVIDDGDNTVVLGRPISASASSESKRGVFGFASRLRSKSKGQNDYTPASTSRFGRGEEEDGTIAAMALPQGLNGSRPVKSAPLAVDLVPKGGAPWPFGAPVPFWRGAPYERLKWGGFEADVVGVRNGLFSHAFIIRVRRPQRLDEYVLRTEAQFLKYFKVLDKQFPSAHIRRIPTSDPKDDAVIAPAGGTTIVAPSSVSVATTRRVGSTPTLADQPLGSSTRLAAGLREAARDNNASTHSQSSHSNRNSVASNNFAKTLRSQSLNGDVKAVRGRRNTLSGDPTRPNFASRAYSMISNRSSNTIAARLAMPIDMKKMPPFDARRRALRAWLRDTLSIRTIGHHKETAAFLLLGPMLPKDRDVLDIAKREMIDEARRAARVGVAGGAAERARMARNHWDAVERECIHGDGFVAISEALRNVSQIEKLPARYFKTIESLRYTLAQALYDLLVGGDSSGPIFAKLKALHAAFPYFLIRQAFKIGRSRTMAKYLQDILLARPFGSKSLLQKILAITLDDDPSMLLEQIARYRQRIGSATMTEKLDIFVYETREKKDIIRKYAQDNGLELVLAVVRGADEPRLPAYELDRVVRASKRYRAFMKTRPSALAKAQNDDPDVRLVLDLQYYLRLVSRDRDSNVIRELLGEDAIASALEVLAGPFVELIKRIYKVGNLSSAVASLQKFLDQLIIIVEALRSRIQEPQKSVRIIARLLARHQQDFYDFIRSIHRGETIIEELLQWFWTASVFLRRGLAEPVDLDSVLPEDHEEKLFFLYEVEDLVAFHRKKRAKQYQATCRRFAGDVDADDPVIVEGDGKGKSKVEPFTEPQPKPVTLLELPVYLEAFQSQLKRVFAV